MTFEEAENAHNDINQWWAARDSGSTAPPDYKALWQTPTSNNRKGGKGGTPKCVCVFVSIDVFVRVSVYLHSCIGVYLGDA